MVGAAVECHPFFPARQTKISPCTMKAWVYVGVCKESRTDIARKGERDVVKLADQKTKIVATIRPTLKSRAVMERMIHAGMNVAQLR